MKKISLIFSCLFCIALAALSARIAIAGEDASADWARVQSDNGEISFLLPPTAEHFYEKDGFMHFRSNAEPVEFKEMHLISAYHDKILINVEAYKPSSPKNAFDILIEAHTERGKKTDLSRDGFKVKEFTAHGDYDRVTRYIASKTHLYVISLTVRGAAGNIDLQRIVSSILLHDKQGTPRISDDTPKISALRPSTFELVRNEGQAVAVPKPLSPPVKKGDTSKTQSVLIVQKPYATYPDEARQRRTIGDVRLRLTFNPAGRISRMGVMKELPDGLLRSAIFAALRIKFLPAEKDGKPVEAKKIVEYSFSIY